MREKGLVGDLRQIEDWNTVLLANQTELKRLRERGEKYIVVGYYAGHYIIKKMGLERG